MPGAPTRLNRQQLYRSILIGTLIYSVVLGFFSDYTDMLYTASYSTTFLMALLMQCMVFPTLILKKRTAAWFKTRDHASAKAMMVLSVWLIMFSSKFVFLAAIDIVFGSAVHITGFVALLLIILSATVLQALADYIDTRLER
jgi:hypothetical protein